MIHSISSIFHKAPVEPTSRFSWGSVLKSSARVLTITVIAIGAIVLLGLYLVGLGALTKKGIEIIIKIATGKTLSVTTSLAEIFCLGVFVQIISGAFSHCRSK